MGTRVGDFIALRPRYGVGKLGVPHDKRRDPGFLVLSASSPPCKYPPSRKTPESHCESEVASFPPAP